MIIAIILNSKNGCKINMNEVKKNSILIVDDETINLMALTNILSSEYTIYTANNGRLALEVAHKYLPDLILMDIVMPEMDGYEAIAKLKSSGKTRAIPIICITSLNDVEDEERGLFLGAASFISKPFSSQIVKLKVQSQFQLLQVEKISLIDQLTDMPNRLYFYKRISKEWDEAIKRKKQIAILLLDLDNFKEYNEMYGYIQGDMALQTVVKILTDQFNSPEFFVARWEGDEFVALLKDIDLENALDIAELIRAGIENAKLPATDDQIVNITASIGLNRYIPTPELSVEEFIRGADDALYTAKTGGKNRVCHAYAWPYKSFHNV